MQSVRQTNLFLAEDWTRIYTAFQQVNFSSYDFDSIRASLVDYIRLNYPEEFNDWIESSEFVALIDLIAYLGQSLAFRMDLNTRENFLETAESRESVLRLARMLSYSPQRNYPAFGLAKVVAVQTDEPLIDSEGRNLSGIRIGWNSTTDQDWLEHFILVLNSAFNVNNPFGNPVKSGTINNIATELYEFNNIRGLSVVYPFNVAVSGAKYRCEVINPDFEDLGVIEEKIPDPFAAYRLLYRNDRNGNASPETGFFVGFKQGQLSFKDFELSVPIENRLIDLSSANVNETDVWFQEVNSQGIVVQNWTKVPTVSPSSNIVYNAIEKSERDIYSVITREDDQVSLRFADGRFGNIPLGVYRFWYRTSNGLAYTIKPQDIQNFTFTVPYQNLANQNYNLTISYSLQYSVNNSSARESIQDIKRRAPQVYYTQDRMVNGEDYNIFPLLRSDQARKIKAVNRTYSGHSRFININDPTGTYQNTTVFSSDGIFYKEYDTDLTELSRKTNITFQEIIAGYIAPIIRSTELLNFVRSDGLVLDDDFDLVGSQRLIWTTATQISGGSTGYFVQNSTIRTVGEDQGAPYVYITENSLVNLVPIDDTDTDGIWVKVTNLTDNGDGLNANGTGTIIIDERIDSDIWIVKQVLPSFSITFSTEEEEEIQEQLELKNTFGLGFDYETKEWYIIETQDLSAVEEDYDLTFAGNTSGSNLDASWLVRIEYGATSWRFYNRDLTYVWESVKDVRFFYSPDYLALDNNTGRTVQDKIEIFETNSKPDSNEPLDEDLFMQIDSTYLYADGFIEPRRIKVTVWDSDQDGTPDDPQVFEKVVGDGEYIFWERYTSTDGYEYLRPIDVEFLRISPPITDDPPTPVDDDLAFVYNPSDKSVGTFFQYDATTEAWVDVSDDYTFNGYGRKELKFKWDHYAARGDRIDPAITNIIDMFVLSTDYHNNIRNWIKTNGRLEDKPKALTTDQLRLIFQDLEAYKVVSDEIIWRPATYKILFGNQALEDLRAIFKVVKIQGTGSASDNEIKSKIVTAIDEFFDINNWDFGETFYFTELASFIHQRLATLISSIILVPLNEESAFGNLFQVKCEPNEIFLSAAKVSDIEIVDNLTVNSLRIGN